MCGIAGFVGEGDQSVLEAMTMSLRHRGPDAGRVALMGDVGLGHRRLSILDLSDAGVQPMRSADGRYIIVYNGEIFNYRELSQRFLASVRLKSGTDTEAILELFARQGAASFAHLRGMYAIAIYDTETKTLYLHRDRFGKKPLFYRLLSGGGVIFGSELKTLRQHPGWTPEVDTVSVAQYLLFEYIPAPRTIYKGVHKLEPGVVLVLRDGVVSQSVVPTVSFEGELPTNPLASLDAMLKAAVERRLVADVPVGVFLSGGLDSSLVAAYAQAARGTQPLKTFSIGFEDKSFDEQAAASAVSQHLGTEHYPYTLSEADILRLLPKLPRVLDEPMGDSSIIPTLLVSEHARKQVTVSLSGDGADELFLGYETFYAHKLADQFARLPGILSTLVSGMIDVLPVSHRYMSLDFKAKRFMAGTRVPPLQRNTTWLSAIDKSRLRSLFGEPLTESVLWEPVSHWHQGSASLFEGIKAEYQRGYLVDDILVKTDRASMAFGLEVRSPFLDEEVAAFANALPDTLKLHGRTGKYILKQLAATKLPSEIIWRKKQGFNFPIGNMIRGTLKDEFKSAILDGGLLKLNLFKRDTLEAILEEHQSGRVDHRKGLWSLYVLSLWANEWS